MFTSVNGPEFRLDSVGTTAELSMRGEIDMATAPQMQEYLDAAFRTSPETLVCDLRGLTFIDSTGIAGLVGARRRALESDIRFVALTSDGAVRRLIELCGLTSVLSPDDLTAPAAGPA